MPKRLLETMGARSLSFAQRLEKWRVRYGRNDLPWRGLATNQADPYPVWVSETMLQQTQVKTVVPYFKRFIKRFDSLERLASATQEQVLQHWSGLGYYRRAILLHRAAAMIVQSGQWPQDRRQWQQLPGIGRSTAAAICALSFEHKEAILDGNSKRVLARYHALKADGGERKWLAALWQFSEQHVQHAHPRAYTEAIMDLGATVCTPTKPDCGHCPLRQDCQAHRHQRIAEFPPRFARNPKRRLEQWTMLLLRQNDTLCLIQRPQSGIWAGLWTPPVLHERSIDIEGWGVHHLGQTIHQQGVLPIVHHRLTHLDIRITPVLAGSNTLIHTLPLNGRWMDINGLNDCAIAAPVKKIMLSLRHFMAASKASDERDILRQTQKKSQSAGLCAVAG